MECHGTAYASRFKRISPTVSTAAHIGAAMFASPEDVDKAYAALNLVKSFSHVPDGVCNK
jgi:hypothetical protein